MAKSTNVLLIYPRYTYPRKNPPMGLAYLAAYIRREGFQPLIIDLNVSGYSPAEIAGLLNKYRPLAAGISFMTNQYSEALKLARLIKSNSGAAFVIAGGSHISALPQEILRECPEVDFSVTGEGEVTFLELLKALADGRNDFEQIPGLCFRAQRDIIQNSPRALIEDVDTLPFPAWDLLSVEKYSIFSVKKCNTFALLSSRGCPGQCIFCDSHAVFGRKFRGRGSANIFKEIMFLHKEYGMTQFDFVDDMITLQKGRVLELCDLLKKSGVSFTWMANARVNTLDEEMLKAMKDSGCQRIDVGVESGDPAVRKRIKKGITDEDIIGVHNLAKKIGIQIGTFTMVGNLGESPESVRMTVNLLKDLGEDVMISIACPFPGTELYKIAKENGYLRVTDWPRYVTSPTYLKSYQPVMVTDKMDQKEILKAYYYLHSFFVKKKFQARYGKYFLLNPAFFKEWLFKSGGNVNLPRKIKMFLSIVKARLFAGRRARQ